MDYKVLSVFDYLRLVIVCLQPSVRSIERNALMHLFPEWMPWISPEIQQCHAGFSIFTSYDIIKSISLRRRTTIQQPLDIDFGSSLQGKFPEVPEPQIPEQFTQLSRHT